MWRQQKGYGTNKELEGGWLKGPVCPLEEGLGWAVLHWGKWVSKIPIALKLPKKVDAGVEHTKKKALYPHLLPTSRS